MMASRCNPQYFLNPRLSLRLLALVLTWHFSVSESVDLIQLRGEVGGNVTFRCPVDTQKTISFFYLQKGYTFVNGYYDSKNISDTWENTRVDRNKTTVHMYSLNVSHSGDYQCHIWYSDSHGIDDTVIHLSVTANYSKPVVTVGCSDDGFSCLATCASHGGYPVTKMIWNVARSQMWNVVNSSEMRDPDTMMVNSSSTAYFNCSNGELKLLSCSVGHVTSERFSVCTPKDPPETYNPYVIPAAICAVVVFSIIGVSLLCWKCKKGQRSRSSGCEARVQITVNASEEEVKVLNEKKRGQEAS